MTATSATTPTDAAGPPAPPAGWRPLVAAGVTMILWASAFVVIRYLGPTFDPGPLAFGRLAVGSVALTIMVLVGRRRVRLPRGRALAFVIGYGALWFGLYTIAVNAAGRYLDAGTSAMLVNLAPIIIAVLAGMFLQEGFPRTLVLGLVIAFVGVATIAYATSTGRYDPLGAVLAVAAAVLYAVGVLSQKKALQTVTPMTATWLGCLVGTIVTLPFAPTLISQVAAAPARATLGIAYLGVFPTAIAFSTWAYALSRTSAGKLSASTYVVPALTVLISWVFLGETPAALALLGGAVCLVGVACTRLPGRRPSAS